MFVRWGQANMLLATYDRMVQSGRLSRLSLQEEEDEKEEEEEEGFYIVPYNENGHVVVQEAQQRSSLSLLLILPSQHTVWRSCNNDGTAAHPSLTGFVTLRSKHAAICHFPIYCIKQNYVCR